MQRAGFQIGTCGNARIGERADRRFELLTGGVESCDEFTGEDVGVGNCGDEGRGGR